MRAYDNGSNFSVTVTDKEVDAFNQQFPYSSLSGRQSFLFEKKTGDLVDRTGKGDGDESVALCENAKNYGKKRLGLE